MKKYLSKLFILILIISFSITITGNAITKPLLTKNEWEIIKKVIQLTNIAIGDNMHKTYNLVMSYPDVDNGKATQSELKEFGKKWDAYAVEIDNNYTTISKLTPPALLKNYYNHKIKSLSYYKQFLTAEKKYYIGQILTKKEADKVMSIFTLYERESDLAEKDPGFIKFKNSVKK